MGGACSAYRLDQFIQERLSLCGDSFGKLPIADFLGIAVQFFESVVYVNHQAEFLGTQAGYKVVVCAEERDVNVVVHHYGRCIE